MERISDNSQKAPSSPWDSLSDLPSYEDRPNYVVPSPEKTELVLKQEDKITRLKNKRPDIYDPETFDRQEMHALFEKSLNKLTEKDAASIVSGGVFDYQKASAVLTKVLALKAEPELSTKIVQGEPVSGCDMYSQSVELSVSPRQNATAVFDSLAHEYWHAHQRDEIDWYQRNKRNKYLLLLRPSRALRAEKYYFNRRHYLDDSVETGDTTSTIKKAYEEQFVETESYAFAKMASRRFNTLLSRANIDPSSIDILSPVQDS